MAGLTGILCAVEQEMQPFLALVQEEERVNRGGIPMIQGKIGDAAVVLVRSGMGKVNAACAAQCLIDSFPISRLLISGVGGSMDRRLRLFDLYACDKCTHHDLPMEIICADYPRMEGPWFYTDRSLFQAALAVPGGIRPGVSLTGECFIDSKGRGELQERFAAEGLIAADMETAAVAQVCLANRVPFCAIRAVSDTEEERGVEVFWQNVTHASALASEATINLLRSLK